jgi:hypothetical protein
LTIISDLGALGTIALGNGGCGGIGVNLGLIMNRQDAEIAKKEEGVAYIKMPFQSRGVEYLLVALGETAPTGIGYWASGMDRLLIIIDTPLTFQTKDLII